jgi:ABC-type transport system involved in multi-copper enzyme maturation permease subunit
MNSFFSFQALEFKRFCRIWKLAVFFLVFIIFFFSLNRSSVAFKRELTKEKEFQKNEAATFEKLMNYEHYSDKGIKFLVVPSQASIFFANPYALNDLSSRVNSIASLEINKNVQGKNVFKGNSLLTLKFSDLVSYIGVFLALFMGAEAMGRKEYLKLLSSRMPGWKLLTYTILSRFIVLTAGFILVSACMLLVPLLHGVGLANIDTGHLWVYLGWALLMLLFFLVVGHIMGSIARSKVGLTPLLIVWFVFVFVIPSLSGTIDEDIAESLQSIHKLYHDKLQIVNNWEKRIVEQYGKTDLYSIELKRKLVNEYFDEEYPKIEALEKELRDEIALLIKKHRDRSIWTPVTFNNLLCCELSSRGYENYLKFLDHNIKKHREFLRFWINMVYYKYAKGPKKLENFIKGDENVFRASIKLPDNTGTGFLINGVWILLLFIASHFCFKRSLFHMKEKEVKEAGTLEMEFDSGYFESFLTRDNLLVKLLYNLFSGHTAMLIKKGLKGEVSVNDVDILKEKYSEKFFFICRPEDIPRDIRVKHLFSFIGSLMRIPKKERNAVLEMPTIKNIADKKFKKLNKNELFHAALALTYLVKSPLYLINDIAGGKDKKYTFKLMERVHQLKKENAIIIYLATPTMISDIPMPEGKSFTDGRTWFYFAEGNRLADKGKENGSAAEE